jgi:hypothetical protein
VIAWNTITVRKFTKALIPTLQALAALLHPLDPPRVGLVRIMPVLTILGPFDYLNIRPGNDRSCPLSKSHFKYANLALGGNSGEIRRQSGYFADFPEERVANDPNSIS